MLDEQLRWTEPNDDPAQGTLVGEPIDREDEGDEVVDFAAGAKLGRYVVLAHMGGGGMGVVYSAYDPELDRRIALKLMHQRSTDEAAAERASKRLLAEAKAMARLSHPNVITVHDVGTIDERVFIAMEYVDGVPLSEWMRDPSRDWRERLDMFLRAARGLQAAHAVGLVHRDFKPDNVLVGADGRVRVLDFGLAQRFDEVDGSLRPITRDGARPTREGSRELSDRRDREAGTPAYMSPEQHLGKQLDHRADQFSFCVALYEALYGELPFAAKSRLELALAVTDGRVGPAPKRAAVPNWIRWALLRGLDPEPEGRWEDMASLIDALSHDPYHKHRVVALSLGLGIVVVGLLAAVIKFGFLAGGPPSLDSSQAPLQCTSSNERVAEVWDDRRREQVRAAFAKLDEPWAAEDASEVEAGLARWAASWATMHRETCESSAAGEQSGLMLDRRMLCLDRYLAEFDALVEVVTGAEAESYARAREAVRKLPDLSACEAAAIDRAGDSSAAERELSEGVMALERDLSRTISLEMIGAFAEAAKLAEASVERAKQLDDPRLYARALWVQARVTHAQGHRRAAVALLEQAELAAERAQADSLRGRILTALARADAEAGDVGAATRRVGEARAVLDRVGASELEYAALDGVAALAALAAGDPAGLEEVEQQLRGAVEIVARLAAAPVELAELRATLGVVLRELGRPSEARVELEQARKLGSAAYGEQHPIIATFALELARVDDYEGRHEAALLGYVAALDVFERAYGANSIDAAHASAAMAVTLGKLGRYEESLRRHHAARAVFRAKLGSHGDAAAVALARALDNEGLIRRALGQLDEALSLHQQALALLDRGPPGAAAPLLAGQLAERARVLTHLAEVLVALEREPEARAPADEALDLLARTPVTTVAGHNRDGAPSRLANLQFLAAKAWMTGESADREGADALAREARRGFEALGEHDEVAAIDRWLAGLPG